MGEFDFLNEGGAADRLAALRGWLSSSPALPALTEEVNDHIHTCYSFSPYSPTLAAVKARLAGLSTAGSIDHDSIAAAREMKAACALIGIASTVGCEIRVNFTGTAFAGYKLNNPDSANICYMTIHGVPEDSIDDLDAFLAPIRKARDKRNRAQVAALNALIAGKGIGKMDYDLDVVPLSKAAEGGGVTERHILKRLSDALILKTGRGLPLVSFLETGMGLAVAGSVRSRLLDPENPYYGYDLLGLLKSSLLDRFFTQPDESECLPVGEACAFANSIGAIPAYAYLGDIAESPTGDKKPEKFEDAYLDDLVPELARIGFRAITSMPPRNTREQLLRVRRLCEKHGLMEISGVDINSPRQSMNCPEVLLPDFRYLIDSSWALVAHEKLSGKGRRFGLFNPADESASSSLPERIRRYAEIGRKIDRRDPEGFVRRNYA
jgi:hypothetical protein